MNLGGAWLLAMRLPATGIENAYILYYGRERNVFFFFPLLLH